MSKKLNNRYARLTKNEKITAHTVLLTTDAEHPELGRWVKASLWVDQDVVSAIFDGKAPAIKPESVHLRHHVTRAEFPDPTEFRYQLPRRADQDRSRAARATGRTTGQGHFSGSMIQFAVGGQVVNEPNWVTLGEILALRQEGDHGFPFKIQGLTWTQKERALMTDYLQRYYASDR